LQANGWPNIEQFGLPCKNRNTRKIEAWLACSRKKRLGKVAGKFKVWTAMASEPIKGRMTLRAGDVMLSGNRSSSYFLGKVGLNTRITG